MITRWSSGSPDDNMDEGILVELGSLVARHPWWHARAKLTLGLLEQLGVVPPYRVLDAGCGWGVTLEALEKRGYEVTGLDISRAGLERLDSPSRHLIEADLTQPLPRDHPQFDVVLALDVIEHLDDDQAVVERLSNMLRPGGFLVVSVPALPEFTTEFDHNQGHRRRYTPETLAQAMTCPDLTTERIFWWGEWLVPILKRQRAKPRSKAGETPPHIYRRYLSLPPWPLPLLLQAGFAWEHGRALAGKLKTGTSLIAIAQRA